LLGPLRGLIDRTFEGRIAASSLASAGNQHLLARPAKIIKQAAVFLLEDDRSGRDVDDQILPILAVPVAPHPVLAPPGDKMLIETKLEQRVQLRVAAHVDIASLSSVAARRTAAGHKLLAPEGHTAVASVASLHVD